MGFFIGWRKRLPGGFSIGWRKWLGGSRRRQAGTGCGGLLLMVCCLGACVAALPKAAATATPAPTIASTATLPPATPTRASASPTLATITSTATASTATKAASATPAATATRAAPTVTAAKTSTRAPAATATKAPVAQPTATSAPIIQPSATPAPIEPTATQPAASITLVSLTSPAARNSNATLVVQVAAGAACFLTYKAPSGATSGAAGLGAATANGAGQCSWTWKIGPTTTPGTGHLFVSSGGANASFDIVIP